MVKRKKRDNVPCLITWTHERKEIKVTKCYTRNRRRVTQGRGRKIEREDAPWRSRAGLESRIQTRQSTSPTALLLHGRKA